MRKLNLLCSVFLLAIAGLAGGCGGDCKKASDCAADEVCYNEICQKAFSSFFDKQCSVDLDCDGNGDGMTQYFCELGRCRLKNTMPIMIPDSGVLPDSGAEDAMPGMDAMGMDAMGMDAAPDTGVTDTGTTSGGDM